MERKFIKRAAPFGGEPPTRPTPPTAPTNSPAGPPNLPSKAPGGPPPSPTPPNAEQGVTEQPEGLTEDSNKPRSPEIPPAGGTETPTDVQIDAATGHITIKKGPINFTIAKYDPSNPPDKVSHLPEKSQRQWVHIYNSAIEDGDDEETAHKKAWGAIPDKGKKNKQSRKFKKADSLAPPAPQANPMEGGIEPAGQQIEDNSSDYVADVKEIPGEQQPMEDYVPQGKYSPGDSVKTRDPETGQEQYGFVVEINENGLYTVNYEDGSTRQLHEGWLIDAPEAANAGPESEGLTAKKATHKDWDDFRSSDSDKSYGDWGDETTYQTDTHDNPFANPKNRTVPPTFTVNATVPDHLNPQSIAFALQTGAMVDVEVDGNNLTIDNVTHPLSLITELADYGIDAETSEDLTKFDQGINDFKQGQKVAIIGDFKDMNYFYNPRDAAQQAYVVAKEGDKYILENNQWGRFLARREEIANVR